MASRGIQGIGLAALLAACACGGSDDDGTGDGTGDGSGDGDGTGDGSGADASPRDGACAADAAIPESGERTLSFGGRDRTFNLHVPSGYDRAATPLVLNFHGYTSNAGQQEYFSVMSETADREGFAVAYPQGTGVSPSWNAGACCGSAVTNDIDDVGFTAAMIDAIAEEMCLDSARVYSTGFSNGGFLSHRLACELSDRIAAIAPVAGVMGIDECNPTRAVPVAHFHGTLDGLVPIGGSAVFPSVEETIDDWAERNGCSGEPQVSFDEGDAHCERWDACDEGSAVELCIIDGGGHTWPGGRVPAAAGKTSTDLSATDRMWAFFAEHPLP